MPSNTIVTRVQDFFKLHPPFSYLPDDELERMASFTEILYFQDDEYVFKEEQPHSTYVYILKKGRIELTKAFEGKIELLDVCEAGDVFGVRSLLTENPYVTNAKSTGDALIYAIPRKIAIPIVNNYPRISLFFAAGFAAGQTIVHGEGESSKQARQDLLQFQRLSHQINEIQILTPVTDVVSCSPKATIRDAALLMKSRRVGSVVVMDDARRPIGMVSDSDFTRKVVAGQLTPKAPITALMSSPVITLPPDTTMGQFTIRLMREGIRRIVITEDGTDQTPVVGILSERELLAMQGNHPAVLVKRMWKSKTIDKLSQLRDRADDIIVNYLKQEVSIEFISDIITEINDTLIQKAIEFSLEKLEKEENYIPSLRWAWLSLGSEGRGEQLLRTDQDNAIIYENPSEDEAEKAAAYFLKLGKYVVDILVACGFVRCKGDIMASNPKWNQSLDGWKKHFGTWIEQPSPQSVMHGNIFFDFRRGYGDESLTDALSDHIFKMVDNSNSAFSVFFVKDTVEAPPPLSFFKNFIVERSGKHKDMFDIKKRAMMPLAGAARMLMVIEKVKGVNNTFERYRKLAEIIPNRKELFEEAAEAYEVFMRFRALNAFQNNDSGRFIQPKDLNKIERQTLRTAFKSIEDVQRYLRLRFNLGYM